MIRKNRKELAREWLVAYLSLLYWENFLFMEIHHTLQGYKLWNFLFLVPMAFIMASLCGWLDRRLNKAAKLSLFLLVSLFYIGEYLYYRSFGSLVSVAMLGTGGDALSNFGWSLKATVKESVPALILLEVPLLIIAWLLHKDQGKGYELSAHAFMFICGLLSWLVVVMLLPLGGKADHTVYGAYHSRYIDTDSASARLGALPNFLVEGRAAMFGLNKDGSVLVVSGETQEEAEEIIEEDPILYNVYEDLDLKRLAERCEDDETADLCYYLASVEPSVKNEYTGLFEGYNLIYICAESFSSLAIDEEVTPTLYKMANNGIVLNNYYNSFKNTTTNGEYAFLSGLWPDVARQNTNAGVLSGTMGQSIGKDMTIALGNMFKISEGLEPRGYHNYLGNYYGRNKTLPNMGFSFCRFMNDGMEFTTAWPASDLEMIQQSVDDYLEDERFLSYYMTFSGHGNYTTDNIMVSRNLNAVSRIVGNHLPTSALGYLACNYELEKAMTYLLDALAEAGQLEKTVIVLAGDHYPYYLTDAGYEALKGEKIDNDFEAYHSTCIIYNAGLSEPIIVDTPCCNVDIIPTIYNLFNINYDSRFYAGTDIFGDGFHMAQLYNKSFVTDMVKYNFATGKAEWLKKSDRYTENEKDQYLERAIRQVKNSYALSIGIEDTDLFAYIFDNYRIHD